MSFLADTNTLIYASKNRAGAIAEWLERVRPMTANVIFSECLTGWPQSALTEKQDERLFLEVFFRKAVKEGRYINLTNYPAILRRSLALRSEQGVKLNDALIAATAEHYDLTLVTADTRRNFAPRLEQLNAAGLGAFKLKTFQYEERETTFALWNAEADEQRDS